MKAETERGEDIRGKGRNLLEFNRVSYRYPGEDSAIVEQLSFSVEPGSFHCD